MTGASLIRLMILRGPEQRGQTKGDASYTLLINRAQDLLHARANSPALSHSSRCISGPWAAGEGADAAGRADTRRALDQAP